MYQLVVSTPEGQCETRHDIETISDLVLEAQNVVWWDIEAPTEKDVELLRKELNFHPLAIEDGLHTHQKPKIERYSSYYFIVFYSVDYNPQAEDASIQSHQISLFIGPNYLVTLHTEPIPEIRDTTARWQKNRDSIGSNVGAVVYALLDAIVDDYFPVLDEISEQVEDLEAAIFSTPDNATLSQLFSLKKSLLAMRRVIAPGRDVLNVILRRDMPVFEHEAIFYMQDIYDHVVRVTDSIDIYRDLMSSALDSYLSVASNRMNQTMRVLTASSIILMSMALVAGIYGMNFKIIPELEWTYGYPFALLLMLVIGLILTMFFRRQSWL